MPTQNDLLEELDMINGIHRTPMNFHVLEQHTKELLDILSLSRKKITIQLGRSKDKTDFNGTIQNIQVYLDDTLIIDSDTNNRWFCSESSGYMYLVINRTDHNIPIATNNKNDQRYLMSNQAYVWNIALPQKYQHKWLAPKIYQAVANLLQVEIVRWDDISKDSQTFWKKHKSFMPHLSS